MTYILPVNDMDVEMYGCESTTATTASPQVLYVETEKLTEIYIDGRINTNGPVPLMVATTTTGGAAAVATVELSGIGSSAEGNEAGQTTASGVVKNGTGRRSGGSSIFVVFLNAVAVGIFSAVL